MEFCDLEKVGEVSVLRLNRPPMNAINLAVVEALTEAMEVLEAAPPAALVLTGAGESFSAGLDLKEVTRYSPEEQRGLIVRVNRMASRIYGFPAPVVGAINGHAIAAGFCLVAMCDYRIGVSGNAKIGLTEARVGIPYPAVPMEVIRQELDPSGLRKLVLQAQNVTTQEGLAIGLFDELVDAAAIMDRALVVAREMAAAPREGYTRIKQQLRKPALDRIREIVANNSDPMLDAWLDKQSPEASAVVLSKKP